jgi:hypothetical protein
VHAVSTLSASARKVHVSCYRLSLKCSAQPSTTGFHQSASNGSLEQTSSVQVLPAAEYCRVNDLVVHGESNYDHVPEPCQTFESAGYPADLLEEVRDIWYLHKQQQQPPWESQTGL